MASNDRAHRHGAGQWREWGGVTGPQWAPVDDGTADLLSLVADDPRKDTLYARFLLACRTDDECHGYVSVNRVRKSLSNDYGLIIEPRLYSAFWAKATSKRGPMRYVPDDAAQPYDICKGSPSGNNGKPQRRRLWVGTRGDNA